jgi:hypothetical protein
MTGLFVILKSPWIFLQSSLCIITFLLLRVSALVKIAVLAGGLERVDCLQAINPEKESHLKGESK